MSAIEAFRRGDVSGAISALQDEIRNAPEEPKHRIFLFQLLTVVGNWSRALTQLNVARDLDPEALLMAQTYQEVLQCEALRHQVFIGQRTPMLFGEPEAWMAQALEAQKHAALGDFEAAKTLREKAWDAAPTSAGTATLAGKGEEEVGEQVEFEWLADADTRIGPFVEAVIDGRYYWVPMLRIQQVAIEAPTDLRDIVWTPARFLWANEGQTVGMIPTRYSGSESHSDDEVKLARRTEWSDPGHDCWHGLGQRLFVSDTAEFGLMSLRKIEFQHAN